MNDGRLARASLPYQHGILPPTGAENIDKLINRFGVRRNINREHPATTTNLLTNILSKAAQQWDITKRPIARHPTSTPRLMDLRYQLAQVVLPLHSAIEIFVVKLELRQDILVTRHTAHQSHHKYTTRDLLELVVLADAISKLPKLGHNARVIAHEILHKRWAKTQSQCHKEPIIHRTQRPGDIARRRRSG